MKIDLHVHTRYSEDAINSPEWIMRMARRRGLDGVAVTDHNIIRGWKSMQEAAKRHSMELVLGEEIKVTQAGEKAGEIIGLFLNEEIKRGDALDVIDKIRQQDGIVVIAHPFDRTKGFRNLESFLPKVDAIEAFNSRVLSPLTNARAFEYAALKGAGMTGGSDAHIPLEVGLGYTAVECSDLEGFRKALKRKETSAEGRMIPLPINLSGKGLMSMKKAAWRFARM